MFQKILRWKKTLLNILIVCLIFFFFGVGVVIFWVSTFKVPSLDSFNQRVVAQSTKIYDKTGEVLLFDVFQGIKRTVVPLNEISKDIKNATIAIEDKSFYTHGAIKPSSIIRAIFANISSLSLGQGGSTITQQVVKNSILSGEKSISRKLKEWVLAIKLEQEMSKDDILNIYLNEIPYGGSVYGVEKASEVFFGKKASEVTLAEAAYLASLPQAPSYYSPFGSHVDKLNERKDLVLSEMLSNNFITKEEYDSAKNEQVVWRPQEDVRIKAPHFVQFVRDYLENKYGDSILQNGGLKVITTLDYDMQQKGEEILKKYATENKKNFNAENAALVAIDPKTGDILTMVGSRDYFDKEINGQFNVTTAHRQPGSSFKPFAYAEAFIKGFTPDTVLFDVQTEFSTSCNFEGKPLNQKDDPKVCYMPNNYDGKFIGPVTMRNALAQSINIPAIKTLYLAGTKDVLNLATSLGIKSLTNVNQYGLTLVLGGGEVSLLDMTSAYSVFANNGVRNPYKFIKEIKDKNGKIIEQNESKSTEVLPGNVAAEISSILSDNVARTPLYGSQSLLYFPGRDVAAKTGTTNDYRDAWILGYTPDIAVGTWAGNNNNSPMDKKISGLIVAPMWRAFMDQVLPNIPNNKFRPPEQKTSLTLKPVLRGKWQGGISTLIDKASGLLATQNTPEEFLDEILTGGIHSILYWVDKDNPNGPTPSNPSNDPQFNSWEYAVQKWIRSNNIYEPVAISIPTSYDNIHTPENAPTINITSPQNQNFYGINDIVLVYFQYNGRFPFKKVEYYVNNNYIGSSEQNQSFSITLNTLNNLSQNQPNTLKVIVYDSVLNKGEAESVINVR